MYRSLKERGRAASNHYAGTSEYFTLSPAGLSLLQGLQPLLKDHCRGRVLDAGAGRGAYRELLADYADEYVGLDVAVSKATSVLGDAEGLPFVNGSFDTIFCSQVLEHVPQPWLAMREFQRVLRPGGKLLLTVPHLSWLHNEPHDYWRFTGHGLNYHLAAAGFRVIKIAPAGGLFSLLGHIPATLCINLSFGIPYVHNMIKALNRFWVSSVVMLDRHLEKQKIFALNYICLAEHE